MKITDYVSKIKLGEVQVCENVAIFPLFLEIENVPNFITLESALKSKNFFVKEVSNSGTVPHLKVINKLDIPVFIMDGEELRGGKQNRVLNTSILVKKNSEVIIPVSCTERGRWSFSSDVFEDPEYIIPVDIRRGKNESVFNSLIHYGDFESDQLFIWNEIDKYHKNYKVDSKTDALRDVLKREEKLLKEGLKNFPYIKGQNGIMVFTNGEIDGLDIVSLSSAYELLHEKIIKSYLFKNHPLKNKFKENYMEKALSFFDEIKEAEVLKFKSVSLGWDLRFSGEKFLGSMLVYRNKPIHMNFFKRYNQNKKPFSGEVVILD